MTPAAILVGLLAAPVLISYLVEGLRRAPAAPTRLDWAPGIPVRSVKVGGLSARYIVAGQGPALVLLHTLRTQLDIFQRVVHELAEGFTVYAVDFPGHGWSDIPDAEYAPELFTGFVRDFLETLGIEDALLAGVSIGGSSPLLLAAEGNPRIRGVVAINPYDYGWLGAGRANAIARVFYALAAVPVVGGMVMRFRNRLLLGKVLEGGVVSPAHLPPAFTDALARSGDRPGHYRAFLNLIRHLPRWRRAHQAYGRIRVPVLLVYGDHDWARKAERQATLRDIPRARMVTVENGGHFLPLDQPGAVVHHIRTFAQELYGRGDAGATGRPGFSGAP